MILRSEQYSNTKFLKVRLLISSAKGARAESKGCGPGPSWCCQILGEIV